MKSECNRTLFLHIKFSSKKNILMNKILIFLMLAFSSIQLCYGISASQKSLIINNHKVETCHDVNFHASAPQLLKQKDGKKCKLISKAKQFIYGKENDKFARISYIVLGILSLGFISIGVLTDWKGKQWIIALAILVLSIAAISILLSAVGTVLPLLLLLASPIYAFLQMKKYYS